MLKGYKTWVGIVITILGVAGVSKYVTPDQMNEVADIIIKLVGIGITIYGNYDSHNS